MFQFSNPGSPIRQIREPVVRDGKVLVEVVGQENFQDYIQSFADSCDINLLVARAVNGDESALNQRVGSYGDFTEFPKTYAEILQRWIDAQNLFDSLTPAVRSRFNNDVYQFVAQMDEKDWFEKAGFIEKKPEENIIEEEVKE